VYAFTTFKNGSDIWECLKQDKFIKFTPQSWTSATNTPKEMSRICANNTIKHEELPEANLESMYAVVISICDPA